MPRRSARRSAGGLQIGLRGKADGPVKVGMISLGCPKNQVDAEQMLGVFAGAGFVITPDQAEADVIVVNTCGFIESAKEESIEAVLAAAKQKKRGKCRALIVAGCLAQRYRDELARALPEADAIIGTAEIGAIGSISAGLLGGAPRVIGASGPSLVYGLPRVSTTPRHSRYLKIAEGCDNRCSYCAIPIIRGGFTARPSASIVDEARKLAAEGARELILLAQDSMRYRDRGTDLPRLVGKLARIRGIDWVRLMYVYPGRVSEELIRTIAEEEKVCKYLDIPIQHIDDAVLAAMNRRGSADDIKRTIETVRRQIPGIALRTSVIVGFPGETEAAFSRLLAYVKAAKFEHLGAFVYSAEEGTPAARLPRQVPAAVARERLDRIMRAQARISLARNKALVGTTGRVLVDGLEDDVLFGRFPTQAPEIDGAVYLSETDALPGDFVDVVVTQAAEYDVTAVPVPAASRRTIGRKTKARER